MIYRSFFNVDLDDYPTTTPLVSTRFYIVPKMLTAGFRLGHLNQLQAMNLAQQPPGRLLQSEFAQAVAAAVERDLMRKSRAQIGCPSLLTRKSENSQVRAATCPASAAWGGPAKSSG